MCLLFCPNSFLVNIDDVAILAVQFEVVVLRMVRISVHEFDHADNGCMIGRQFQHLLKLLIRERLQAVHVFFAIGFYDYLDIGDIVNVVCDVGDATVVDAVFVDLAMVVASNLRFQPSQVFSQLLQLLVHSLVRVFTLLAVPAETRLIMI